MDAVPPEQKQPVRADWTAGYEKQGIVMDAVPQEGTYRWDKEVVGLLAQYGPKKFRKCDIWETDWNQVGRRLGTEPPQSLADPRTRWEKRIHRWLRETQTRSQDHSVRLRQRLLRMLGW